MALLLPNGNYVKIDLNGNYDIYASKADRTANKNALTQDEVLKLYDGKISAIIGDEERMHYDQDGAMKEAQPWIDEKLSYVNNFASLNPNGDYPLLQACVEGSIGDTIPRLVERGSFARKADTLKDQYDWLKKSGIFGDPKKIKKA